MKSLSLRKQQLQAWINQSTNYDCKSLEIVSGDASFRRYFRFTFQGLTIIAVDAPPEYENASQFIDVANSYQQHGVLVPEIYAYDLEQGFYLQQDFGNQQFSTALNDATRDSLYTQALAIIPAIQNCISTKNASLPSYNAAFIEREFALFTEWLVERYLQLPVTQIEQQMISDTFDKIKTNCLSQPSAGVHRDYHSRNLMLVEKNKIGVIDFQDAVIGPITYDAVSLLRDSYQKWPPEQIIQWLAAWHEEYFSQYPWDRFKMWFDTVGMQRHIKIAGIFARLAIRDGKQGFLQDIPHTLDYLIEELGHFPEYSAFLDFIQSRVLPQLLNNLSERNEH